ncbi:MAG: hypothetical protein SGPRY_010031 [Prymnesium sp.]
MRLSAPRGPRRGSERATSESPRLHATSSPSEVRPRHPPVRAHVCGGSSRKIAVTAGLFEMDDDFNALTHGDKDDHTVISRRETSDTEHSFAGQGRRRKRSSDIKHLRDLPFGALRQVLGEGCTSSDAVARHVGPPVQGMYKAAHTYSSASVDTLILPNLDKLRPRMCGACTCPECCDDMESECSDSLQEAVASSPEVVVTGGSSPQWHVSARKKVVSRRFSKETCPCCVCWNARSKPFYEGTRANYLR